MDLHVFPILIPPPPPSPSHPSGSSQCTSPEHLSSRIQPLWYIDTMEYYSRILFKSSLETWQISFKHRSGQGSDTCLNQWFGGYAQASELISVYVVVFVSENKPMGYHTCLHGHLNNFCLGKLLIPPSYQCTMFVLLWPLCTYHCLCSITESPHQPAMGTRISSLQLWGKVTSYLLIPEMVSGTPQCYREQWLLTCQVQRFQAEMSLHRQPL